MTMLLPAHVPLNYVSLFSGIGGFDIGFDRAGMRCKMQVEFNEHASGVLAHHWPTVERLKDVRDVKRDSFRTVDLICGGFPCQDVSVAGRRAGLAGERSGLWFEFLRIITEHTPRWVVIENVPGLLSSNSGRDFATVIQGLVECGYRCAWRVLDAQYFGVPQRRRRVFIVASLGNGRCAEVLFEREGSYGNPPPSRETGQGFAADAQAGVSTHNRIRSDRYESGDQASTLTRSDYKSPTDLVAYNVTFCDANGKRADRPNGGLYVNETEQSNTLTNGGIDGTLVAAIDVRNMTSNGDISGTLQSKKSGGYSLNYINPIAIGLSSQLNANEEMVGSLQTPSASGGGHPAMVGLPIAFDWQNSPAQGLPISEYITPPLRVHSTPTVMNYGVRRLTPTECERLQGFPDGHTAVCGQSDSARYKQLGNAVCVNVAEWLGRRIAEVDTVA